MSLIKKTKEILKKYKVEILLIISFVVFSFVLSTNYSILHISGNSMQPTYDDKDIVIIKNKKLVEKDDIIVFSLPPEWAERESNLVKRVYGIEGDRLELSYPKMKLNGVERDFSAKDCFIDEDKKKTLSKGEYFVVGDNVGDSNDSYYQYCSGNDNYTIREDLVKVHGKEVFKIGGFR